MFMGGLISTEEHRTCSTCFDEGVTQSNYMPKLTFTMPMNRRLADVNQDVNCRASRPGICERTK